MAVEVRDSLTTLAERTGVPRSTVHYRSKGEGRDGYVTQGRDGRRYASPKVRAKRIAEHRRLRADGLREWEIAARTGWPRRTVNRDLRGVTTPAAESLYFVTVRNSLPQGGTPAPHGAPKSKTDQGSDDDGAE